MAESVGDGAGAAGDIAGQVREWATYLITNALIKWPEVLSSGVTCESPDVSSGKPRPCQNHALATCDICGRRCCLAHARVDYMADAICEECIGKAKARARAEPKAKPPTTDPQRVRRAFRTLGLKPSATYEEVRTKYRELVFKWNADRPQSAKSRERNTVRLQRLNDAYRVLREHFEAKKEAA